MQNWMRNKDVIAYLGLWEKLNNEDFKGVEFDTFKNEAYLYKLNLPANRMLSKTNYHIHTDSIKEYRIVENTGHTYRNKETEIENLIYDWIKKLKID